jgi:hypothetical protein
VSVLYEEDRYGLLHQKLTAANFGPGKPATGLNHERYTAWPTTYTSQAAKLAISTVETKSIVDRNFGTEKEEKRRGAGQKGKGDGTKAQVRIRQI